MRKKQAANVALMDSPMIIIPGCKILDDCLGLEIKTDADYTDWETIGRFWGRWRNASKFMLGDWLNFGEAVYGEKYSQGMTVTGHEVEYLTKVAYVARHVQFLRRRKNLSWEHHYEVAKLSEEEQVKWLEIAEQEELNLKELRASIKAGSLVRIADEQEKLPKEKGLVTIEGIIFYAVKWINENCKKQPVDEWSQERRQKVKGELAPIIEFHNQL